MGKNLEQQANDFNDNHKDLTGPDAGTKISEDLFKATQGMSEQQKREFYTHLDGSDSAFDKVHYDYKDTNNDGAKDSVIVSTEYDANSWLPGGLTFQKTNAMEEIRKLTAKKESPTRGTLERAVDNVHQRNEYVDQNFDQKKD